MCKCKPFVSWDVTVVKILRLPGSGNKGNFDEVLASLIQAHTDALQPLIYGKECLIVIVISFLQAQAAPNNLIQLYAELMKRTTKPHWICSNRKRQYYRRT